MAKRPSASMALAPSVTVPVLSPLPDPTSTAMARRFENLATSVQAMTVTTAEECASAQAVLKEVVRARREWEEHEWPGVQRLYDTYKESKRSYETIDSPLTRAEKHLKAEVGAWQLAEREKRDLLIKAQRSSSSSVALVREQTEKITNALEAGDLAKAERLQTELDMGLSMPAPSDAPPPAIPTDDQVRVAEKWEFEIFDESLLPREYLKPDERAIGGIVRALKGKTNIPGVRVFKKARVSVYD